LKGATTLTAAEFPPAFLIVAGIAAASAFIFAILPSEAGAELSGRKAVALEPPKPEKPDQRTG
jgi:hypothetical protein